MALIIVSSDFYCAPTGRNEIAQGNALGFTDIAPLPGALPRAISLCPFGALRNLTKR
ncbi:hypothetical protein CCP4SC76_2020021 [Gammaproteobacteria bacterium]